MYNRKSSWQIYLAIGGAVILLVSLIYTYYLSQQLAEGERQKVNNFILAQEQINDPDRPDDAELTLQLQILQSNTNIPVILMSKTGDIQYAVNFGEDLDNNEDFLLQQVANLEADGFAPIENQDQLIYYKESRVLRALRYFPLVQLILIGAFIFFGYLGFSSARRAEQNRVWVGMAKETAHQLGTPISAIVAWIEHLRATRQKDTEVQEVIDELQKDIERLELIADRFSKIGSAPKLETINVVQELEECRAYMQRRASRKVKFHFPDPDTHAPMYVMMNSHLFDWVIENLLRNALDAMDGKGTISTEVYEDDQYVHIDITDTGKGISPAKHKRIFQPGYTTKTRGWGLGLSLAKRIIENYHDGKIFVKRSQEGAGTTFTIKLRKHQTSGDSKPGQRTIGKQPVTQT